ncbi:uncharacterized protein LOC129589732 [Paramacrobiotus metropolitanus]|uniref:uncharacterized protein LOC129589732 n=1 Tax=Paramacrobiotus metropolitanus TaxID=2943436 RepID=UPI0024464380|nr:uncharacterized protein LOC129589732 [Paramacrobiotus metropolitanus]
MRINTQALWIQEVAAAVTAPIDKALADWKKDIVYVGQVLDPAFKDTLFGEAEKGVVRGQLKNMLAKYSPGTGCVQSTPHREDEPKTIREKLLAQRTGTHPAAIDEVEEYLNTATVHDLGIMDYWKIAKKYPRLQKLAMDLLGIPVTSVQSERENSRAKHLITDKRNRLSTSSVQATLCLKSWNGFLKKERVVILD